MSGIEAIVSDFGGVLTSPLLDAFRAFEQSSGIPLAELGTAMATVSEQDGANPLFELETGRITERAFLERISSQLSAQLGRPISMEGFGDLYFGNLHPNEALIEYMRELKRRGYKLAICTNNVREWELRWRAKLPVEEIFMHVIDSAFVGVRKPDPAIYRLTLEQLGLPAQAALLLDDIQINCDAARQLGMSAVWFQNTEQAIAEIEAALGADADGRAA